MFNKSLVKCFNWDAICCVLYWFLFGTKGQYLERLTLKWFSSIIQFSFWICLRSCDLDVLLFLMPYVYGRKYYILFNEHKIYCLRLDAWCDSWCIIQTKHYKKICGSLISIRWAQYFILILCFVVQYPSVMKNDFCFYSSLL